MTTFYLDPVNGNDANAGDSFAAGHPWQTITSGATAARIAPGDVIRIAKSPDPTSLGQTALWTNLSRDVVLQTGAVTAEIDNFESADANWTESANCTDDDNTAQYKLGANSYRLQVGAAFTTGKASYRDFGAGNEKNLSGYQQISFWFRNSVAIATAGDVKIKLCSDSAGATPVNTFSLPAIPSTNQWIPITLDNGSALGSSIRSVAIYVDTDFGAVDLYFDNLIACKAPGNDALTLQSLISKNSAAQGGTEPWFPIQSINGATIKIDNHTNNLGNAGRGYTGTTETVTTYKRETIKTALAASSAALVQAVQDSGAAGSLIEFQGGYDTGTNTQNGVTIFDGLNGFGNGLDTNSKTYLKFNYLAAVRYNYGFYISGWYGFGHIISNFSGMGNTANALAGANTYNAFVGLAGQIICSNNGSVGLNTSGLAGCYTLAGATIYIYGNLGSGIILGNNSINFNTVISKNNSSCGADLSSGSNCIIGSLTTADNTQGAINFGGSSGNVIKSLTYSESTLYYGYTFAYHPARISIGAINGNSDDKRILTYQGSIASETSVRHTNSGYSWRISPTVSSLSAAMPLFQKIAEIAVNANAQVTVSAWLRRTNTGITGSLVCRGGQIAGVDSDVTASMTAAADTWQQVTITFTPTAAGVVEIETWAYGGTTYSVYVDDLSISQA